MYICKLILRLTLKNLKNLHVVSIHARASLNVIFLLLTMCALLSTVLIVNLISY